MSDAVAHQQCGSKPQCQSLFQCIASSDARTVLPLLALRIAVRAQDCKCAGVHPHPHPAPGHGDVGHTHTCSGVDLDARNHDGETALMLAARQGNDGAVRLLASAGPSLNAATVADGITSLHEAAMYGFADAAMVLLAYGARLSTPTGWGETALQLARRCEHMRVAAVLALARRTRRRWHRRFGLLRLRLQRDSGRALHTRDLVPRM